MAGLEFESNKDDTEEGAEQPIENAADVKRNSRLGITMFLIYVVFYGGFMLLSAFKPEVMSSPSLAGINLSVIYGFLLIVLAIIFAVIYMVLCTRESKG